MRLEQSNKQDIGKHCAESFFFSFLSSFFFPSPSFSCFDIVSSEGGYSECMNPPQ